MVESLPSEMGWGFVKGRIIHAIADTPDDSDDKPEARAATGEVVFTPKETLRRTVEHFSAFAIQGPERVRLATEQDIAVVQARIDNYEGEGTPSGPDYEIPELGELVDSSSRPGIWMVEGTYTATFNVVGGKIPSFELNVAREYTRENPLVLSRVGGVVPGPGDTLLTLKVPSGGIEGQVLASDGSDSLVWADPSEPDASLIAQAVEAYLQANPPGSP